MGLRALGDSAWLFEAGGDDADWQLDLILKLVKVLRRERIPEVVDIVSSFASVAVYFDPADGERVLEWLTGLQPPGEADGLKTGRTIEIPVVYGDLEPVAKALGRGVDEIVKIHSAAEYTVAALGFSPGFPYLAGLPEELVLPRLTTPRPVEAGAVAIAGKQAGIYPHASQGGWHVLGKTELLLFDPSEAEPSLLKPGDQVRFVPVTSHQSAKRQVQQSIAANGAVEVIETGPLTSIQDLGRRGFRHLGVTLGGAADPVSARVANRLVGNDDNAAVLECCLSGPLLKFHKDTRLAFVGWADGRSGSVIEVSAGDHLDLRCRLRSLRGYLAIAGGIDVPRVLASRSTDVRAGFGGYCGQHLKAGDRLPIAGAADGPKPGSWRVGWPEIEVPGRMIELRFLPGMQMSWFMPEARAAFRESAFEISPASDRMGVRFLGEALGLAEHQELVSQPVIPGSVQVPPDGKPIVLMAECQTIGGYPQIGHLISADLPKLARAWPGTKVRFREVTLDEARRAWRDQEKDAALLQTGLDFLR